ncbi:MAG: hypothetical protein WCR42_10330 [bacterium]
MKIILITVIALFVLSSISLVAQTNLDVIYLKNGKIYKGRISTDVPPDYLEIQLNNGEIKKVFYQDILKRELEDQANKNIISEEDSLTNANNYAKEGSYGLGIGEPFGGLGANVEYMFAENFAATIGLGFSLSGIAMNGGGRVYFAPKKSNVRPMFDIYIGNNLLLSNYTSLGFNIGAGFKAMFGKRKKHGLEIELIYILTSTGLGSYEANKTSRAGLSVGYRIGF